MLEVWPCKLTRHCVTSAPRKGPKAPARLQRALREAPHRVEGMDGLGAGQVPDADAAVVRAGDEQGALLAPSHVARGARRAVELSDAGQALDEGRVRQHSAAEGQGLVPQVPRPGAAVPRRPGPGPGLPPQHRPLHAHGGAAPAARLCHGKCCQSWWRALPALPPRRAPSPGGGARRCLGCRQKGLVGEGKRGRAGRWEWRAGGGAGLAESGPGSTQSVPHSFPPPFSTPGSVLGLMSVCVSFAVFWTAADILVWDVPGDVPAAPGSALCGCKGVTLSLSLSHSITVQVTSLPQTGRAVGLPLSGF